MALREPMAREELDAWNEAVRGYEISSNDLNAVAVTCGVTRATVLRWLNVDLVNARRLLALSQVNLEWWQKSTFQRRREILARVVGGAGVVDVATLLTGEEKEWKETRIANDLGQAVRIMLAVVEGDIDAWFAVSVHRMELIALEGGQYEIHVFYLDKAPDDEQSPGAVGEEGNPQYGNGSGLDFVSRQDYGDY